MAELEHKLCMSLWRSFLHFLLSAALNEIGRRCLYVYMEFSWSLDKYDNTVTNVLKKKPLHLCCLWVGVRKNGLGNIIFLVREYHIFIDLSHLQPDMYNAWRKADVCQVVQWISNDISSAEAEIFHLVLMLKHLAPRLGRYTGDNKSYMYSTFIGKVTIGKRQENLSETWITAFFFFTPQVKVVKWLGTH